MSTKYEGLTVSPNGQQTNVSGSLPKKDVVKVMRWLLGYAPSFPAYEEGQGIADGGA